MRFLSRRIVWQGREHRMAVAEILPDGIVTGVRGFNGEEHSTVYVPFDIDLDKDDFIKGEFFRRHALGHLRGKA